MKAYLAGAMEFAPDSGIEWRKNVTEVLRMKGWEAFDPCVEEFKGEPPNWEELEELKNKEYPAFCHKMRKVVNMDLMALEGCDILVVKVDRAVMRGAGTLGELTWARWYNLPIYAWIDMNREEMPGWVSGCIDPDNIAYSEERLHEMLRRELVSGEVPVS